MDGHTKTNKPLTSLQNQGEIYMMEKVCSVNIQSNVRWLLCFQNGIIQALTKNKTDLLTNCTQFCCHFLIHSCCHYEKHCTLRVCQ